MVLFKDQLDVVVYMGLLGCECGRFVVSSVSW